MKAWTRLAGHAAALAGAIALGGYLRFDALGEPSYWLDEILSLLLPGKAAAQPWWHWLTGLDPENGPLYIATQFASRLVGSDELASRFPSALLGCATIVLVWLVAKPSRDFSAAACAFLLATSPLHVYYSREARPYALLMFLTAAILTAMMLRTRAVVLALLLLATLYTSATAAPVLAAVACTAGLEAIASRKERRSLIVAACAAIAGLLIPLLYRGSALGVAKSAFWPLDREFASTLLHGLTVSTLDSEVHGRAMVAILAFAIAGAVALACRDRRAAIVVGGMTLLPFAFTLLSLRILGHWFALRYFAPSLIGFIVLTGTGIVATCRLVTSALVTRWPRTAQAISAGLVLAIVAAIGCETWPAARREAFQKLDWRAIAKTLQRHARPGDVIATAEPYSYVSLQHYLRVPPSVHFVQLDLVPVGEEWVRKAPAAWLVSAAYTTPVSEWMCRYPLILASPLEGFELHYAPSAKSFLLDRSTLAEQRAGSVALGAQGFTLRMVPEDDIYLGDGWANAEVSRWAVGRRATLSFPRGPRRDRRIRFRAYPLTHATLPAQTMRVSLNGTRLAELTLAPEWRDYEVQARSEMWVEGMNKVTFDFGRATAPSAIDVSSPDDRELSTSFERISIDDAGFTSNETAVPRTMSMRVGADWFVDERTAWRNTRTNLPAAHLRREAVEPLLARLGFDPATTWPRLASGEVRLDNVVQTIAYGGHCEDHATFLRRAFSLLLRRSPSDPEMRELLGHLAKNPSRVVIVGRIAKSTEFRGQVLAR